MLYQISIVTKRGTLSANVDLTSEARTKVCETLFKHNRNCLTKEVDTVTILTLKNDPGGGSYTTIYIRDYCDWLITPVQNEF